MKKHFALFFAFVVSAGMLRGAEPIYLSDGALIALGDNYMEENIIRAGDVPELKEGTMTYDPVKHALTLSNVLIEAPTTTTAAYTLGLNCSNMPVGSQQIEIRVVGQNIIKTLKHDSWGSLLLGDGSYVITGLNGSLKIMSESGIALAAGCDNLTIKDGVYVYAGYSETGMQTRVGAMAFFANPKMTIDCATFDAFGTQSSLFGLNPDLNDADLNDLHKAAGYQYNSTKQEWVDGSNNTLKNTSIRFEPTKHIFYVANPYLTGGVVKAVKDNIPLANPYHFDDSNIGTSINVIAIPEDGYGFSQWSDGIKLNPRTISLAKDTAFSAIAEFVKNTYTVLAQANNPQWGTTTGGGSALYLDEVQISATPNYGYHFVQWNDGNVDNPRRVTVTGDATFTAYFETINATDYYFAGTANGWSNNNEKYKFVEVDGVLTLEIEDLYGEFKITENGSWHPQHGAAVWREGVALNGNYTLVKCDDSDGEQDAPSNANILIPENKTEGDDFRYKNAKLTLDASNPNALVISLVAGTLYNHNVVPASYYLIGACTNNWSLDDAIEFKDVAGVLTANVANLTGMFKIIKDRRWGSENEYASNGARLPLGEDYKLQLGGANISLANPFGGYANAVLTLTINGDDLVLKLVSGTFYLNNYDWFIPGAWQGWKCDDVAKMNPVEGKENTYELPLAEFKGEFKVVYGQWAVEFGVPTGETSGWTVDTPLKLSFQGGIIMPADPDAVYQDVTLTLVVDYEKLEARLKMSPSYFYISYNYDNTMGRVSGPTKAKDNATITASPNYGYHFVQWSDGNNDNPRTIVLTQDTTFTAEFAKNTYFVTTESSNLEYGTTSGGGSALYLDQLQISATAHKYGYHFAKWNDGNTESPRVVTVTGDATYTANFEKNTYYVDAISGATTMGSVNAPSSAKYLDEIKVTATPKYGYHFTEWNDGVKDNPRYLILTQDTVLFAEFAIDVTGTCGKNYALAWTYNPTSKSLTISGNGSFDEHMECGVEAKQNMTNLVIDEGVTSIGNGAFSDCSILSTVQLPASLKIIGERAFSNCLDLTSIYNYRENPCLLETSTFEKVNTFDCKLYVLAGSVAKYRSEASGWKIFYEILPIGATETTAGEDVIVKPQDNVVTLTWPINNNAASYVIEITKDGVVFCRLIFDANGQLTGIAFVPNRDGYAQSPAANMVANGMQFTVTGLNSNTNYAYSVTVKDNTDQTITSYEGSFKTTGAATSLDQITNYQSPITNKIIKDNQLFILRGDKTYTITGQQVK